MTRSCGSSPGNPMSSPALETQPWRPAGRRTATSSMKGRTEAPTSRSRCAARAARPSSPSRPRWRTAAGPCRTSRSSEPDPFLSRTTNRLVDNCGAAAFPRSIRMNDALTIAHPRAAGSFRRRKGRALAALAFVIAMPVVVAAAPTPASAQPAGLTARANAILEAAYPADGPGAAVIVTRGDRTLFAAGRGLADIEAGRPVTPDTILGLGSITKQFTAAVILQLVQE